MKKMNLSIPCRLGSKRKVTSKSKKKTEKDKVSIVILHVV